MNFGVSSDENEGDDHIQVSDHGTVGMIRWG